MASHVSTLDSRRRVRRTFGQLAEVTPMPNLIDVQRSSYDTFLQMDIAVNERGEHGLQETFDSIFPIEDFAGRAKLEFVSYDLEQPKYDVEECQQRGLTFASSLKVTLRLEVWEEDEVTGARSIRDIKEQDVYMGDMPLMTSNGTFIVNGTERVIVSQMHRSPGVFFDHDRGKTHASGKLLFAARVIPYRGSWLDFEFDAKDILNVRIDRKRKLPVTTFLMALPNDDSQGYVTACADSGEDVDPARLVGMSREEILKEFYGSVAYLRDGDGWSYAFDTDSLKGGKLIRDLIDAKSRKVVAAAGTKMTPRSLRKLSEAGIERVFVPDEDLVGRFLAEDFVDMQTGEVI
ncbi:MAG: DNA-directed RNA polymerase subunit beta, partial [Rhodobiaceae bacterium]